MDVDGFALMVTGLLVLMAGLAALVIILFVKLRSVNKSVVKHEQFSLPRIRNPTLRM